MNTINLSRREELCRNLNMNFDEASELFSDETLESMQMAKVNGGGWRDWLVELLIAGATWLFTSASATPGDVKLTEVERAALNAKILGSINDLLAKDKTLTTVTVDSIVDGKVYGLIYQRSTTLPPPPTKVN